MYAATIIFGDILIITIIILITGTSCYFAIKRCLLDLPWIRNLTTNIQIVPAHLVESPVILHNDDRELSSLPQVPTLSNL